MCSISRDPRRTSTRSAPPGHPMRFSPCARTGTPDHPTSPGLVRTFAQARARTRRSTPLNQPKIHDLVPSRGYRWRAENGGLPPARLAEEARSGRYLSLLERQRIATLRRQGLGVRAIAEQMGRGLSTDSRELRRNTATHDRGYDGDLAHARARERARRPRRGRLLAEPTWRALVQAKLELEWSPEQIAAWLRQAYPDRPGWHVCHETIYQALYRPRQRRAEPTAGPAAAHRQAATQTPPPAARTPGKVHRADRADRPPPARRRRSGRCCRRRLRAR
jgi:hypothetical protein